MEGNYAHCFALNPTFSGLGYALQVFILIFIKFLHGCYSKAQGKLITTDYEDPHDFHQMTT